MLLLALLVAFGLQWKSFTEPERMHENWRARAHWLTADRQQFQPDDRLLRYQRFDTPPLANALYGTLSRSGYDVEWGKINGILWFALTAALLFVIACKMAPGRSAGWIAALTFLLFPSRMEPFVGGFMSGLAVPLLGLALLVAFTRRWWWGVPLVALEALALPPVALQSGLLFLFACLRRPKERLGFRVRFGRIVPLLLVGAICFAAIATWQMETDDEFGKRTRRGEIGNRIEFTEEGQADLIPTPSIVTLLWEQLVSLSYFATCLFAFLVMGKRMLSLPRGLWPLLFASVGMLCLADVLLTLLGVPEDYMARGVPLFAALTSGVWMARLLAAGSRPKTAFAVALLAALALIEHHATFAPTGDLETRRFDRAELYEAVRRLPAGTLLATHPRLASELPLMTGHSVVVSAKLADPIWTEHWKWCEQRMHDVLRAYYAHDPNTLLEVTHKYGIDYWVVDRRLYGFAVADNAGLGSEPFRSWARDSLRLDGNGILRNVPDRYRQWSDDATLYIVATEELERYADDLQWERRPSLTGSER